MPGYQSDIAKLKRIFQTNNTQRDIVYKKLQPTNRNIMRKRNNLFRFNILTDYQADTRTRTAAEAKSRVRKGCCNRRLSGLVGDVAKIYFRAQSHSKHDDLRTQRHKKKTNNNFIVTRLENLCARRDSNPHVSRH